ncbi:hypothetical protein FBEOM_13956 [Fusarium beomiforme]|uniref:Uncharacterized protein n=1 Tax=Fusarium beomiforme TaxID=44412 RepID=A0A9P5A4Q2_9HYPO|nr:hypothetical protein FBEOM_13956 [Fusarium beomiforme]
MKISSFIALLSASCAVAAKPECPASKTCGFAAGEFPAVAEAENQCRLDCEAQGKGKAERQCNACCNTAADKCFNGVGNAEDFCIQQFQAC